MTGRVLTRATPREKRRVFDICEATKAGNWLMAIPANVVVKPRASTAGLAKEVEEVNQYAAVITKPTAPSPVAAANLIIIDDMMDKFNLLPAKASALGFSIEGEAGRSDP